MRHPLGASDASPDRNFVARGGMHFFPRKNGVPLSKVARNLEKKHAIYDFPVWRRKSGHLVRSRGHTCEKNPPWGKKGPLAMFASNAAIQL